MHGYRVPRGRRWTMMCGLVALGLGVVGAPRSAVAQVPAAAPAGLTSKELDDGLASLKRADAPPSSIVAFLGTLGVAASDFSGHEDYAGGRSYSITGPVKKTRRRSANLDADKAKEVIVEVVVSGTWKTESSDPPQTGAFARTFIAVLDPAGEQLRPLGAINLGWTSGRSVTTALVYAESAKFQDLYIVELLYDDDLNNLRNTHVVSFAGGHVEMLGQFQSFWSSGTKAPREVKLEGPAPKKAKSYELTGVVTYTFDAESRQYKSAAQ